MTTAPTLGNKPWRFSLAAYVAIIVGVLLAIAKALVWSNGVLTAEVFGYALAGALIPGAIAHAIAGRAKVRNSNRFAFSFLLLSIAFLLLELTSRSSR